MAFRISKEIQMISEIEDPLERYLAFIVERDAIYHRKMAKQPWPWTEDPVLQSLPVYRDLPGFETKRCHHCHMQLFVTVISDQQAVVLPATVLYRWFNRIETCVQVSLTNSDFYNQSTFEQYIETGEYNILLDLLENIPPPHVTGAYIINGKPGFTKGEGVLRYFDQWCQKPWRDVWPAMQENSPTLAGLFDWLRENGAGLGSFMAAQLVADLKYLPFMKDVEDWWTFAAPGPGSMKGMNAVLGRPMDQSWNAQEWLGEIQTLRHIENEKLTPLGPFHAQDTQNHCCEFSKYTKVMTGVGRPRQVYRHV